MDSHTPSARAGYPSGTYPSGRRFAWRTWIGACLAFTLAVAGQEPSTTRPADTDQPTSRPAAATKTVRIDKDIAGIDDPDVGLLSLEIPTIITANRREQKITDLPYAVSIITREDMRSAGARNVPDALRLVPGVDVAELSWEHTAVSPRGFHGIMANRSLVLVDGRQIYDCLFGASLWGNWPLQIEDIERIEVVRGPGSVAWGANAASGVINIITRDPGEQQGLTVQGRGGSRGWNEDYAAYGFKDGPLRLRVSGGYENSDGFNRGGSLLRGLDDNYKCPRMSLSAVYEAGPKDKIAVQAGSQVVDGGIPPSIAEGFDLVNPGSQAEFLLGTWTHKFAEDNILEVTGYVNDFHLQGSKVIDYRYQQLALQVNHTFKPAEKHTFVWGIDTRLDLTDASNADPRLLSKDFVSTPSVGLYAQDEWRFAPRWTFNLGGRVDYDSYGGFIPSGRAALSYELNDHSSVYAAVSRAFKLMPSAVRFVDGPFASGLLHFDADRDFRPNGQTGYEIGYHGRFFDRIDLSTNAFWHESENEGLFDLGLGPPGLLSANLVSRPTASIYGLEMESKYAVTDKLTLLGNYTLEKLDWRGPEFTSGTDNVSPPKHKFMVGARYSPFKDLHLSAHAYYVGPVHSVNADMPWMPRHVPAYLRVDLRAQKDFWKNKAFFAVGVRNLLDPQHPEGSSMFLSPAEVPRMVYAEIGIRLD